MSQANDIAKASLMASIANYEEATQKLFHELVGKEEAMYIQDNLDTFTIARLYGLRDEYNLRAVEFRETNNMKAAKLNKLYGMR